MPPFFFTLFKKHLESIIFGNIAGRKQMKKNIFNKRKFVKLNKANPCELNKRSTLTVREMLYIYIIPTVWYILCVSTTIQVECLKKKPIKILENFNFLQTLSTYLPIIPLSYAKAQNTTIEHVPIPDVTRSDCPFTSFWCKWHYVILIKALKKSVRNLNF